VENGARLFFEGMKKQTQEKEQLIYLFTMTNNKTIQDRKIIKPNSILFFLSKNNCKRINS
jgi:hypothetical protein